MNRICLAAALALAACSPNVAPPLAGAAIGGPFSLIDQNGRRVSDRDFAGRFRILYFGYTYCPDVCPVDVQNIAGGLRIVERTQPALGKRIVPIFITVDPRRDGPAQLRQFAAAFHPRLVGLTGSPAAIDAVAKRFAVYYKANPPGPGGAYTVDHSRAAYLFDPEGKPLALLPADKSAAAVAAEIERWAK